MKKFPFFPVFHVLSVPAGYFKTPKVNTWSAYPNLVLKKLKSAIGYINFQNKYSVSK